MKAAGKVAVVTGAALGVGKGIAKQLAQAGATVVIADINDDAAKQTSAEIGDAGGAALAVHADVTADDDVRRLIDDVVAQQGGVDVWVNNAGPEAPAPFYPEGDGWPRTLDGYLRAVMSCTQMALRTMEKRGGVIVNIASSAGVGYKPYVFVEYAAAKAGVMRLTACLGTQKDARNVRVNCIAPGWVATEAVQRNVAAMTDERKTQWNVPDPMLTPDQIGEAVLSFVEDESLFGRVMLYEEPGKRRLIPIELDLFELGEEI